MDSFFTKDKQFYKTLFSLFIVIALQNLVAYSVNMLDNIMLGSYSQSALSGAATVNQIFFLVNQTALAIGNAFVAIASQYWGKRQTEPIRHYVGVAMSFSLIVAFVILVLCSMIPEQILGLFTTAPEIIEQGCAYLGLLKWTFVLFMVSNLLICALRSVEIVKISFAISVVSLITNGIINYTLIFGHFGFPEMGVRGAAVGTLTSRILELLIVVWYLVKKDEKLRLFDGGIRGILPDRETVWHYACVAAPILLSSVVWSISVPMQTAILGHLSADAIAANSVATTFFQYLKVIVIALSSSSAVIIGKSIGVGNEERIRSDARTLSVIDVTTGAVLGLLLSMYNLSDEAMVLADHLIIIMSCVMVGMSYQMPVSSGIIQSSGDTKFSMCVNLVSIWCIVMPLSFCAAFVWKLPVEMVVLAVQSDQFFKGIPVFLRFRSYKWIHRLTK